MSFMAANLKIKKNFPLNTKGGFRLLLDKALQKLVYEYAAIFLNNIIVTNNLPPIQSGMARGIFFALADFLRDKVKVNKVPSDIWLGATLKPTKKRNVELGKRYGAKSYKFTFETGKKYGFKFELPKQIAMSYYTNINEVLNRRYTNGRKTPWKTLEKGEKAYSNFTKAVKDTIRAAVKTAFQGDNKTEIDISTLVKE